MRNDLKVLILKNRAMGDSIISLSAVQYFKELYPEAYTYFGVPKWVSPLFNYSTGFFDEVLPLELRTPGDYLELYRFILDKKINLIIELFPRESTKRFFNLISSFSSVHYVYRDYHKLELDERKGPIIQKDLDTIYKLASADREKPSHINYPPILIPGRPVQYIRPRIIIGLVASRMTKMWPIKSYVELANRIKSDYDVEVIAPLSSSKMDNEIAEELSKVDLMRSIEVKRIPLSELANEFYGASLYIGNDTGLKHLCIALGVRTFSFFGPEPPQEWHPYDVSQHQYFYIDGLECRTERNYFCDLSECESMICLNKISVDSVYEDIRKFLR